MNRHEFKMNFAAKSKARSFATMGNGFLDGIDSHKMEETLQLWKQTLERERKERKNRGGQVWKSGQTGKLATYANTILQSKLSNKKIGKVKMLTDEKLNLPNRNEFSSLSKKLSDISNHSTGTFKSNSSSSSESHGKLCGQCESNGAALCCIQCTEVYCTACFSAYHQKGALRKHRSISLEVSSTPRLKHSASSDTRLFDLPLVPTTSAKANCQQSSSSSPSGASGALKKDEQETLCRMNDDYDEAESAASFQEAVMAWRTNNYQTSEASGASSVASVGIATFSDDLNQRPPSLDKPKKNAAMYTTSGTSTVDVTGDLASVMGNSQAHTLSYAEQLLIKRNRRVPISWESDNPGMFDVCDKKENLDEMKRLEAEESLTISESTKKTDRLNLDEPLTFSALYNLVAQDTEDANNSNSYKQEILPIHVEKNEPMKSDKFSASSNEIFPQRRASVVPLVESFPVKSPTSFVRSESDEKNKIQSETTGKKIPTNRAKTPKKQKPKSGRSSKPARPSNLTTTPSKSLQMVSHLTKYQHGQNDEQQPSFLMAGLGKDATSQNEVSPRERRKSNNRSDNEMRVSYTLYKMSPCSWHPDQSISQNLAENQFHPSDSLSDWSRPDQNSNTSSGSVSIGEAQYVLPPAFNSSPNTIKDEKSSTSMSTEEVGNFPASQSLYNQGVERMVSPLELSETPQILACLNNNATVSQCEEEYEPIFPYNLEGKSRTSIHSVVSSFRSETSSPTQMNSPSLVCSARNTHRSKTMPEIATTDEERQSDSARSLQRNKSLSPDFMAKTIQDILVAPIHSVKYSPRSKTILSVRSEQPASSMRSATGSTLSMHSIEERQKEKIESRISSRTDAIDNFQNISIYSTTNTPRTDRKSSVPKLIKKHKNHSSLSNSTEITPKQDVNFHVKHATAVHPFKDPPRSKSASAIPASFKPEMKITDALTPRLSQIDSNENLSKIPVFSPRNLQRSKSAMPMSDMQKTPLEIATTTKNSSSLFVLSKEDTSKNKTYSPIPTIDNSQPCLFDTPVLTAKSTLVSPVTITSTQQSISNNSIFSEKNIPKSQDHRIINSQEGISYTPVSSLRNTLISSGDTQEDNSTISVRSIPTIIDTQENIGDTPIHSVRSILESPVDAIINTQEDIRDTPVMSVKYPPVSPIPVITNIQKSTANTPINSMNNMSMYPIPTIPDNHEIYSDTPFLSMKSTPEVSVPPIFDGKENISGVIYIESTPKPPVSAKFDAQESISTSLLSMSDTPKRQKSETRTRSPPISDPQDKEYKSLFHQMMLNNESNSFSLDSEDEEVVSLAPFDTDQTENEINFEQQNSPSPSTQIIPTCMEANTTSHICTISSSDVNRSSSNSVPLTTGVNPPENSEETPATHDKMNTIFYMCNSELYPADGLLHSSGSEPIHDAGVKLKRNPSPTKKYIIPRPPEHPDDGTKQQNFCSPRSDALHPNSASISTSSSLEMKRIHFKQSNQSKNAISIEAMKLNAEQASTVPDLVQLSPSQNEKLAVGLKEDDHESVFSSLTKLSVDSLDEEKSQNATFNEDDFLNRDDFHTEIAEMEDQIADEMKLKTLK